MKNIFYLLREILKVLAWYVRAFYGLLVRGIKETYFLIQDYFLDQRYGIQTCFECEKSETASIYGDQEVYGACSYFELDRVLEELGPTANDTIIDFGSGKGRPLFIFAKHGFKKVVGVELRPSLNAIAQRNIKKLPATSSPVQIVCQDATLFEIKDENIFFIYNSFGWKTFVQVISNIKASLSHYPRTIRIVYFGPYLDFLDSQARFKKICQIKKTDIHVWQSR